MDIKLTNGARIDRICLKANSSYTGGFGGYVLAHWNGPEPWVVWAVDGHGNTFSGNYFAEYVQALEAYIVRSTTSDTLGTRSHR